MMAGKTSTLYRVIAPYQSTSEYPIVFKQGDTVDVGRSYDGNPEWKDWVWCKNRIGQQGWVPRDLLTISGTYGKALEDYNARELSVDSGNTLEVLRIINGWAWARTSLGETGWVPLRDLEPQTPTASGVNE